jgi:hypothetical protein
MSLASKLVPKRIQVMAQPHVKRFEGFLREFEWTWTKAVLASLILWFVGLTFLAVIPSWWLYYADEIGWRESFWLFRLRDFIASGLYGTPFVALIIIAYAMGKWRRRLRSESESRPTGGYR